MSGCPKNRAFKIEKASNAQILTYCQRLHCNWFRALYFLALSFDRVQNVEFVEFRRSQTVIRGIFQVHFFPRPVLYFATLSKRNFVFWRIFFYTVQSLCKEWNRKKTSITIICTISPFLLTVHLYYSIEMTLLSNRVSDYPSISQGTTRIPGVNDSEGLMVTDVSRRVFELFLRAGFIFFNFWDFSENQQKKRQILCWNLSLGRCLKLNKKLCAFCKCGCTRM